MDLKSLAEAELNHLVSRAIIHAKRLEEEQSPDSTEAWAKVAALEERLAEVTPVGTVEGGVARVGAVTAAIAANQQSKATQLARNYLAETGLATERAEAIRRALGYMVPEEAARLKGSRREGAAFPFTATARD